MRETWNTFSRREKVVWRITLVLAGLVLLAILGGMLTDPTFTREEARSWNDLVAYMDAGDAIRHHEEIYSINDSAAWEDLMVFYYHPVMALGFSLISWMPLHGLYAIWFVIQGAAYLGALWAWYHVLEQLNLPRAMAGYRTWLPVALLLTDWYANLFYGNLTSMLMLLSGLLVLALLKQRVGMAVAYALIIVFIKPQWLFVLILPIVFRQWRLLAQVLAGLVVGYIIVNLAFIALVGVDYGTQTLEDYGTFLTRLNEDYPWKAGTGDFEDYNHSWRQIFLSYAGDQDWVPLASEAMKLFMALPIVWLIWQAWAQKSTLQEVPDLALWMLGLAYVVSMAMLPQLWEAMGSIVFFLYLQGIEDRRLQQISWLYLIYVLNSIPTVIGYVASQPWLYLPQSVPLTMLALLFLYGIFLILAFRVLGGRATVSREQIVQPQSA